MHAWSLSGNAKDGEPGEEFHKENHVSVGSDICRPLRHRNESQQGDDGEICQSSSLACNSPSRCADCHKIRSHHHTYQGFLERHNQVGRLSR